jgi:hypothetical protein
MAFSLRCKSPAKQKQPAAFEMGDRDLYHQFFSEKRVKKNAMLGTPGPYERIMTSAALRPPSGTYSSPVPYHSGTQLLSFLLFFL